MTIMRRVKRIVERSISEYDSHLSILKRFNICRTIQLVIDANLTYLEESALQDIAKACVDIERNRLEGIIIEAGCALGGSAITMACAKSKKRPLFVYDVFGMIPPPSERDGPDVHDRYDVIRSGKSEGLGGRLYYGYENDLYQRVLENFKTYGFDPIKHNISFVKGLFQHTLCINTPVALAHIDCDWYDSVFTCLSQIEPNLVPGGTLIIDDYSAWSGCRSAVDNYFAEIKPNKYIFVKNARLHIVKLKERSAF